jgi:hypothetical protein
LIDFPDKVLHSRNARFLSPSDIEIIKARLDRDRMDSEPDPLTFEKAMYHMKDWKLYV